MELLNGGQAVGIAVRGLDDPQQLWAADHSTRLALEPSGDWCLYRGEKLWSSGTAGRGAVRAFMQRDGDLQLLDAQNRAVWHTNTGGHPGAYALLQTDSNLVVYPKGQAPGAGSLWASNTGGGHGFLTDVGHAVGSAIAGVDDVVTSIGDKLGDVPIVGAGIEATYNLAFAEPFAIANAVASGERIDRVALDSFARTVAETKAVAPYVQIVASYVPGLGTGLSAAIGAGLALASGKTVDQALLAGVAAALPGQPLSGRVFDVASHAITSAVQGKALSEIGLDAVTNALPISEPAKAALHAGLEIAAHVVATGKMDPAWLVTPALDAVRSELPASALDAFDRARAVGNGANVADILIQHAGALLPAGIAGALQTGLALGHAQGLQIVASKAPPAAKRKIVIHLAGRLVKPAPAPPPAAVLHFSPNASSTVSVRGMAVKLPGGAPLAIAPRAATKAGSGAKVALGLSAGGLALAALAAKLLVL